jgi:hypothetical protein
MFTRPVTSDRVSFLSTSTPVQSQPSAQDEVAVGDVNSSQSATTHTNPYANLRHPAATMAATNPASTTAGTPLGNGVAPVLTTNSNPSLSNLDSLLICLERFVDLYKWVPYHVLINAHIPALASSNPNSNTIIQDYLNIMRLIVLEPEFLLRLQQQEQAVTDGATDFPSQLQRIAFVVFTRVNYATSGDGAANGDVYLLKAEKGMLRGNMVPKSGQLTRALMELVRKHTKTAVEYPGHVLNQMAAQTGVWSEVLAAPPTHDGNFMSQLPSRNELSPYEIILRDAQAVWETFLLRRAEKRERSF